MSEAEQRLANLKHGVTPIKGEPVLGLDDYQSCLKREEGTTVSSTSSGSGELLVHPQGASTGAFTPPPDLISDTVPKLEAGDHQGDIPLSALLKPRHHSVSPRPVAKFDQLLQVDVGGVENNGKLGLISPSQPAQHTDQYQHRNNGLLATGSHHNNHHHSGRNKQRPSQLNLAAAKHHHGNSYHSPTTHGAVPGQRSSLTMTGDNLR